MGRRESNFPIRFVFIEKGGERPELFSSISSFNLFALSFLLFFFSFLFFPFLLFPSSHLFLDEKLRDKAESCRLAACSVLVNLLSTPHVLLSPLLFLFLLPSPTPPTHTQLPKEIVNLRQQVEQHTSSSFCREIQTVLYEVLQSPSIYFFPSPLSLFSYFFIFSLLFPLSFPSPPRRKSSVKRKSGCSDCKAICKKYAQPSPFFSSS